MGNSPTEKQYSFLHLEDNPLDAELAAGRLAASGLNFKIRGADCRARFEEALASEPFDLILADYSLPDFDGLSALRMVRARDARIPFVFVSGVLGEDVAVDTLLSGATDYVVKQKLDRLVPAVLRAISEHEEFKSRQRAELDLRIGEERFRKLTDSLPSMVWTCDLNGSLTFTNSLWHRGIGEATHLFNAEIIHPSDLNACLTTWSEAQQLRKAFELDCRYRMRNSDYRWHLVWGAPVEDERGQITGWVGTATDTEQQRVRDAELRMAEKLALTGRMTSVIAHEINNPLEALTNLFYLLRTEVKATPQGEAFLAQVEHELLRISTITRLTLQWSREGGSVTRLSSSDLIDETLRLFRGKIQNKRIQLHTDIAADVIFTAVAGEIRQVLANLLSNAIDAVEVAGNIWVKTQLVSKADGAFATIEVRDNGVGIAPERLPELFRPFRTTKGSVGNGLGLYISKEIVDRHRGQLLVQSTLGSGTSMTIVLPLGFELTEKRAG